SDAVQVATSLADVDFPKAAATVDHATAAFVGDQADLVLDRGALTIDAEAVNRAEAGGVEVFIGTADIDFLDAAVTVNGSTAARVGEGASITADALSVTADSDNDATSSTIAVTNATASIREGKATVRMGHTTEANIGPNGRTDGVVGAIGVGDGNVEVHA